MPSPSPDPQNIEVTVPSVPHPSSAVLGVQKHRRPDTPAHLPFTGADVLHLLLLAVALLFLGWSFLRLGRGRRALGWVTVLALLLGLTMWRVLPRSRTGSIVAETPMDLAPVSAGILVAPPVSFDAATVTGRRIGPSPVHPGESIVLNVGGFTPGSTVVAGSVRMRADPAGRVAYRFTVPARQSSGPETIVLRGGGLVAGWLMTVG